MLMTHCVYVCSMCTLLLFPAHRAPLVHYRFRCCCCCCSFVWWHSALDLSVRVLQRLGGMHAVVFAFIHFSIHSFIHWLQPIVCAGGRLVFCFLSQLAPFASNLIVSPRWLSVRPAFNSLKTLAPQFSLEKWHFSQFPVNVYLAVASAGMTTFSRPNRSSLTLNLTSLLSFSRASLSSHTQ